ncbi:MAG: hypothetical protein NTU53_17720, partial [Planctomycetota bacterium]|nr:hypothetical protein [Planctomycetota bacterium]
PSTFATPPAWTGSAIRMVATTATDPSGVQYFFGCTAGPGHDSGWQDSPEYLDSVSTPGQYTYKVQTRDQSATQNASGWSAAASATVPNGPPTFSLSAPASGSSYVIGNTVTIQWAAENVPSNSTINLCADADATYYNGNDNWLTVDNIVPANGIGSYDWDTTSYTPGTYCLGGYMYSPIGSTFTTSRSWITLVPPSPTTGTIEVTIEQAPGQADPTNSSTVNFTVVFSQVMTGFATGDVTLAGTAGATTATLTGSGTTYNVAVSGMTKSGTVIASVPAGVAFDSAGNPNPASTSTDNTVTVDRVAPQAWLTAATVAAAPKKPPYYFKVTYKDDMALMASTVGAGDIVVYPPKSVKKYKPVATWLPSKKPFGNTKSIVTYYSIPAPGGTWDKADNGVYSVVLVYKHICDVAGNAMAPKKAGLTLGTFKVQIGGKSAKVAEAKASASPLSAVTARPVQKQDRDSLLAALFSTEPVL